MKAVVCHEGGGPDVLRYEDFPDPVVGAGQVLIEVHAAGIQGGEVLYRSRPLPFSPIVFGGQPAGIIREVGAEVTGWRVGQRVVATTMLGANAELVAADAQAVWAIPEGMSFEAAASVPIEFGTAHEALFGFGLLRPGQTVLVQAAASGVGVCVVQLAKAAGATVIGTASSDDRLDALRAHGLDVGINYVEQDVVAAVLAATDGRGADLVVDLVGGSTLGASMKALAYRGRITAVGDAGRDESWPSLMELAIRNATLSGMYLSAELAADRDRLWPIIDDLLARVGKGELTAVVDSTFPFSRAADAHRRVESRSALGRVVLVREPDPS
jgi:NADPH2:quinone reductase